ncbi:unnamed protein product, partial [Callosobruchus maculatus]
FVIAVKTDLIGLFLQRITNQSEPISIPHCSCQTISD